MKKEDFSKAIAQLRKESKKRKFSQAVDLIINFKNVDLKKTPVDSFVVLPHEFTKQPKVCVIVDDDFVNRAKGKCDKIISKSELDKWSKPKDIKRLGREFSFFISQANLMGLLATKFGRILGPLGKMPNPKFGGVIPPGGDVKVAVDKFRKSIRIITKNEPIVKTRVGYEDMKDEEIAANAMHIYDSVSHLLPQGETNIASVILKFTMSKPAFIDIKNKKIVQEVDKVKKSKKIIKKNEQE